LTTSLKFCSPAFRIFSPAVMRQPERHWLLKLSAAEDGLHSIHLYLNGQEVKAPENILLKKHIPESIFKAVPGVVKSPRAIMPELPAKERIQSFIETDLVLAEDEALREAGRCLSCCRVCYNKDVQAA